MADQAVQEVPIDKVVCRKQVRESFDEEELVGLAHSIRESGILQPLLGHREGVSFVLDDGERRLRAAKRAGLTVVPMILDDHELCRAQVIQRQMVCNCQRSDLTAIEKARAIDALMKETQWHAREVARKLGLSEPTVSRLLALLVLPDEVQRRVEGGEIPASTAYQIAIAGDGDTQNKLASEVAGNKLTREAVTARRRAKRPRQRAKRNRGTKPQVVVPLGGGRSITVAGPDLSLKALIEWLEESLNRLRALGTADLELADAVARLGDPPVALSA